MSFDALLHGSFALRAVLMAAVCTGCVSAFILFVLLRTGLAWRLATDIPNDRSLHMRPTPRVGGWGVVPPVVVAMAGLTPGLRVVALALVFLAAVSQIDDRRGLPARIRFAAHLAAVAGFIALYPAAVPLPAIVVLAVLMIWLVNLYNFMDGADGLAGGMALFGFGGYAIAASISARPMPELAFASAAIAGAALGFLCFNFHPARVFLGDSGSISLGFLAGALGYWGWREGGWPIWFPVLTFSPFIADASITLARRLLAGEKFWQAHREHYYQRMVRSGIGHAGTAVLWYTIMAIGTMLSVVTLDVSPVAQWSVVVAWLVVLCLLGALVDLRWRRFQSTPSGRS